MTASWFRRNVRWLILGSGLATLAGALAWLNRDRLLPSPSATTLRFDPPPLTESPYLNTKPNAHYVGSAACVECHRSNHASYLLTPHSRALADLDPQAEPPDKTFEHPASRRAYRVYRRDGRMHHEETLRDGQGREVVRVDLPIRFLIGSGHFCRSYLAEVEGFLCQSPLTWYVSRQDWHMSPGYDFAQHWGFERPVRVGCLYCHAGRVEELPRSTKVVIHEQAIGCESCHGPGSLHAEYHRSKNPKHDEESSGEDDFTIVNPGKLSRPLLESVCAACHLSTVTSVPIRGRKQTDYRPGLPLSDFRIDYRFDFDQEQMTVVGHMEQLWQSRCYQKSPDLTCLTCHDPHAKQPPTDRIAYHRQKCLDCHASQPCKVEPAERRKVTAQDSCIVCHMPTGDTDIPHIAFTHHRIGIHRKTHEHRQPTTVPNLVPIAIPERLSELDRQRNLGLAYLFAAEDPKHNRFASVFQERALNLLGETYKSGLRDGALALGLAALWHRRDPAQASRFAEEALQDDLLSGEQRAYALAIRADCLITLGNRPAAIECLEEVVRIRRLAEDWRVLGNCYLEEGQITKALAALQKAVEIRPYRPDIHSDLANAYLAVGNDRKAQEHFAKSRWLLENRQE
ncbi:MAG: tetratricopeptide repeat protein [Gemmatales bacterium]|nr:tetratricopeptide repeat protein [Gemmatales bacterium]MDW8387793.1 tetratricopeptide repeat protein [Gemmatales bacterium]